MTDARVRMLDPSEAKAAAEQAGIPAPMAELNVFRVLLHRPRTAKAVNDLLLSMLFGGALDDRLRELLIMRLGWATGSDYEWTQHWRLALETFGCEESEILAVRERAGHASLGPEARAVLDAVEETLDQGAASAPTIERCVAELGEEATVELVVAIGAWRTISQLTRTLAIPLEDGVESWPPDGRAPTHD